MKEKREKRLFPTIEFIHTELPPPLPEIVALKDKSGHPIGKVELSVEGFFNKFWETLEPDERYLPKEPLERCHLRWERLFSGVWNALERYDPKITLGLLQALKQFGLADHIFPSPLLLYERNPSDELLRRVIIFEKLAHIPHLRGIKHPETRYDPFFALHDYSVALFGLKDFPRRFRNQTFPMNLVKGRLREILPRMFFAHRKEIPDHLLKRWIPLPQRTLVTRLVAYLHGFSVASFQKYLAEARQKYPNHLKAWMDGYDYTKEPLHKIPALEELEAIKREIEVMIEQKDSHVDEMILWLHRSVLEAIQHYKK